MTKEFVSSSAVTLTSPSNNAADDDPEDFDFRFRFFDFDDFRLLLRPRWLLLKLLSTLDKSAALA